MSIRVSLEDDGAGSMEQETEEKETVLLRFSVRDTGIGISADKICILFGKFNQVDASTTRQYGGSGLGLAISRQLAELMDGEAGVSSEKDKGSEFWFTARFGKQPGGAHTESILPAVLSGVRVLIVDDKVISNKEYPIVWIRFFLCIDHRFGQAFIRVSPPSGNVGANLVFALSERANTRFAPTK